MSTEQWGNGLVLFWEICTEIGKVVRSTSVNTVLELFLYICFASEIGTLEL